MMQEFDGSESSATFVSMPTPKFPRLGIWSAVVQISLLIAATIGSIAAIGNSALQPISLDPPPMDGGGDINQDGTVNGDDIPSWVTGFPGAVGGTDSRFDCGVVDPNSGVCLTCEQDGIVTFIETPCFIARLTNSCPEKVFGAGQKNSCPP